ncbi:hypothetical protein BJ875DRAFT_368728, partial [Amylocarpus encephaloides]
IYCASPKCPLLLGVKIAQFNQTIACSDRQTKTGGTMCKAIAHLGRVCQVGRGLEELLKVPKKSGWPRCTKCNSMVERAEGCNHTAEVCICKAECRYTCSAKWQNCSCDNAAEHHRLAAEMHDRVNDLHEAVLANDKREVQEAALEEQDKK